MKRKLTLLGPAFVLLAGLVSCAPNEKSTKDVFIAPPPKIVRAGTAVDLKAWDGDSQKSVSLADGLDVRDSGATNVNIITRCRQNGRDVSLAVRTDALKVVLFQSLVPAEILSSPLKDDGTRCSFEVVLSNEHGSRHIFTIAEIPIHNEGEANLGVQLLKNGQPLPPSLSEWQFADLDSIRLESKAETPDQAQVVCQDVVSRLEPFRAGLRLGDTAFAGFPEQKPRQYCRATLIKQGVRVAASPLFRIYFPEPALEITMLEAPLRNYKPNPNLSHALLNTRSYKTLTNHIQIRNPAARPRWLKIPKSLLRVQIGMPHYYIDGPPPGLTRPYLNPQVQPGEHTQIEDKGDWWRVTLPPGALVRVQIHFEVMEFFFCTRSMPSDKRTDIVFDFPDPFNFVEISEADEQLIPHSVPLGGRMMIVKGANETGLRSYVFREVGVCDGARRGLL